MTTHHNTSALSDHTSTTSGDFKPWPTADIPTLSDTLDNFYAWSSLVEAMADFYDATHLLTAAPSDAERRLAKQLTFFLSRTVAPPHRPALLGKPPAVAWALLQALNPQTGHSLEDLVQQGFELRLTDHGPTSYATEHRLVQSKIVQRQADHHYATPQAYLNRVLKGMDDHPDVRHLRTTFRQIPHPTLADVEHLFRELHDCCSPSTLPSAHAASSNPSRGRGPSRYTRPPRDPTITDYKCSFCKVDNHNTRDCRRKNRTRSGPDGPSRTIEIANAVTLALANLFTNSTPSSPGPSVKDPSLSYHRLPRRYLLDSAASITMHPTTIHFQRYDKSSQAVLLADQRRTPALGEGPSTIPTVGVVPILSTA